MGRYLEMARRVVEETAGRKDQEHLLAYPGAGEHTLERHDLSAEAPAASFSNRQLIERIVEWHREIGELQRHGKPVPISWQGRLRELEQELARRMPEGPPTGDEAQQIARRLREEGAVLVWASTVGDLIAFAEDEEAAARVPCGIVVYTRGELALVLGSGPDTLRLIHEAKKHGAMVTKVHRKRDQEDKA